MPIAEGALGPDVESAFFGETCGERSDDQGGRQKKGERGEQPKRERSGPYLRGCGQPPDPGHGGDVEQHQVPQPKFTPQRGLAVRHGSGVLRAVS